MGKFSSKNKPRTIEAKAGKAGDFKEYDLSKTFSEGDNLQIVAAEDAVGGIAPGQGDRHEQRWPQPDEFCTTFWVLFWWGHALVLPCRNKN